jgi:putative transposase
MANTFTQIHIHSVFAVKYRRAVISPAWKNDLQKYITGIVQHYGHKMLAVNNMPDHIHLLIGFRPTQALSDLMQNVKSGSSKWINEQRLCAATFHWQEGYGAFAVQKLGVDRVIDYIKDQENHHRKTSFKDEYRQFLKDEEIEFDERYIFADLQD